MFDNMKITHELEMIIQFVWNDSLYGEEWREIKGFNGLYFVSNMGRVLSINRKHKAVILKPFYTANGYQCLDLRFNNKDYKVRVSRLVAEAFVTQERKEQIIVHHKDRQRDNNIYTNLQWVTKKEHDAIHKSLREADRKKKIEEAKRAINE